MSNLWLNSTLNSFIIANSLLNFLCGWYCGTVLNLGKMVKKTTFVSKKVTATCGKKTRNVMIYHKKLILEPPGSTYMHIYIFFLHSKYYSSTWSALVESMDAKPWDIVEPKDRSPTISWLNFWLCGELTPLTLPPSIPRGCWRFNPNVLLVSDKVSKSMSVKGI